MRVAIIGVEGMLGREVARRLAIGHEVLGLSRAQFDIGNPESSARLALGEFGRIDAAINCAAFTGVDAAESQEETAAFANALGPGYLARACMESGARLIHISTDFVFDGTQSTPYLETDATNPIGVYGRTKLAGERAALEYARATVIRTAWVFGPERQNFAKTMIRAFEAGKTLRVVSDQVGCPTYAPDLAATIACVLDHDLNPGLYHGCGPEAMSWHEFASRILTAWTGKPIQIEAISTVDWPTPARRPAYSVLDCSRLRSAGCYRMRPVDDAIEDLISQLRANPALLAPS